MSTKIIGEASHTDSEPREDSTTLDGRCVAFHEAEVPGIPFARLYDGSICELPEGRRVEVWRIRDDEGLAVRIFRPTEDGKTSKLKFAISPDGAYALAGALLLTLRAIAKAEGHQ